MTPARTSADALAGRAAELAAQRVPFVRATVVRAQHPTSAHAGDTALVLSDGTVEGFVGGQCAESSVVSAAMDALASGEPVLLRILPDGASPFPDGDGSVTVVNPCLSGGTLEIFVEPSVPAPMVVVVGDSPVALALADVLGMVGFAVEPVGRGTPDCAGALAVVLASHGSGEEETIRAALDAGVGFVGLVASRTRGSAVLAALELDEDERQRVHTPAGIDIGARSAPEIALSIAAQLVRDVRLGGLQAGGAAAQAEAGPPETAIDPVCGMTVTVTPTTPHLRLDGEDHWFCNPGCLARFRDEHAVGA